MTRISLAFRIVLFVLLASPSVVLAETCNQWDVSGLLRLSVSGHRSLTLAVDQNGTLVQGEATASKGSVIEQNGEFDGTVEGSTFDITVYWNNSKVSVYRGRIGPTGRMEGGAFDRGNANARAKWFSKKRVKCLVTAGTHMPPDKGNTGGSNIPMWPDVVDVPPPSSRCKPGFVWRVARPQDLVCVTPEARARTAEQNNGAADHRDPNGAYGPNSCESGYVFREAFDGDSVCVTPNERNVVREENRLAPTRRVGDLF